MKLLLVTASPPLAPLEGTGLVVAALLEQLRDRHDVRVLAIGRPGEVSDDPAVRVVAPPARSLRGDGRLLARWLLSGAPLRAEPLVAALRPALQDELRAFAPDVVHVTPGELGALHRELRGVPAIVAPLDAWHVAASTRRHGAGPVAAALLGAEARRRRRFELREYAGYRAVVTVSDLDAAALTDARHPLPISVIPNGVEAERFAHTPGVARTPAELLFHGSMSHPPNEVAAEQLALEILPRVRAAVPEATVRLVGREPSARVLALGERPGVTVTGAVDDVRDHLDRASVYVCPMLTGSGIKNKVLEAMANGLPVVGTPLGFGGLAIADGREALVAGDAEAVAAATVGLLRDGAAAQRIGDAGREYVARRHSWAAAAAAYEALYVAAARPPAP